MNFLVKIWIGGHRADITLDVVADSKNAAILLAKNDLRTRYGITKCSLEAYSCVEGRFK